MWLAAHGWDEAARAALAIDNARLYGQQKAFADTMQRSLLPRAAPELPGLELGDDFFQPRIVEALAQHRVEANREVVRAAAAEKQFDRWMLLLTVGMFAGAYPLMNAG